MTNVIRGQRQISPDGFRAEKDGQREFKGRQAPLLCKLMGGAGMRGKEGGRQLQIHSEERFMGRIQEFSFLLASSGSSERPLGRR